MNNMSKNKKLLIIILLLIVTIFVYFYVGKNTKNISVVQAPIMEMEPENIATYYCQEGILKVSFDKEKAVVNFPDGKTLNFSQSISADGGRYESGTTVFWSKGDNAFVTENDKTTFGNCVTGYIKEVGEGMKTYTDSSKLFSFTFPGQFNLFGGDGSYTENWRSNTTDLGMLFVSVNIPKSFMPNANFGDSKFTIGTSSDPKAVKNCLKADNGSVLKNKKVVIGGISFAEITTADVGAGSYYDTTSYRTIHDNQCYAIEYTIHSTNIANYSPDQGIKEFDKTKITSIFESMVQSFRFL